MHTLAQGSQALIRRLFTHDVVYASFWLIIITLLFFLPVVIGRQSLTEAVPTFYSSPSPNPSIKTLWQVDSSWHTIDVVPLVKSEIQTLKEGTAPLWAPYSGGGEPQITSNAISIFYPLRLAFFLLWDSTRAFDWYFILRFLISGLGMFYFLRTIGLRRTIALWGGIAYSFTGYFILYISYAVLDIDSLLPWLLLAIEKYFKKSILTSSAPIGFLLAMIIVIGQPQSTIISFLFISLYFGWRLTTEIEMRKVWLKHLRHAIFAIFIALLIASPFIADFLTNYSQGKAIDAWQDKGLTHFPPTFLLHFVVPPSMMPEVAASGHLFDRFYLIIPYVGISVLLLLLISFFIKKKPPQLYPLYIWIGFVILKNAGFPLVHWIGKLPIFSQIGWYKAYGPMAAAMVICAAIAFEYILRERKEDRAIRWRGFYKFISVIPIIFVAAYVSARSAFLKAYVPNFDFFNRKPEMIKKVTALIEGWSEAIQKIVLEILQNRSGYFTVALFIEAAVFAGIMFIIIYYLRNPRHKQRAAIALVIFTAFELWVYMPKIRDGFRYLDPYKQTPPYVAFLEQQFEKEEVSRTFSVGNVFTGHLGELYKIQKSQNNSSIKPRRYFAFLPDEILNEDSLTGVISADKLLKVPKKFFDAFNIRYFLSEKSLSAKLWLKLIYDEDIKIYENQNALPKAYVVFQKETAASPEEARKLFYDAPFDPHRAVILEDQNAINFSEATTTSYIPTTVARYLDNEVDLTAQTSRDGILVLTDTFYLGWQAYLDGKKVPTYPANVMFRGIYLPSGSHTVKFVYEPWWFWPSLLISLTTLVIVISSLIISKKSAVAYK